MKYFALILGFYILSLAAAPVIQIALAQLTSECNSSYSKECKPVTENDGCEKRGCSLITCYYNSLLLFIYEAKYSFKQHFPITIKNNFNLKQVFKSFDLFDIWHPPKNCLII